MRRCPSCKKRPKQLHWNAKWCKPCADERRKRPRGYLTEDQASMAQKLRNSMSRTEIAEAIGTTRSNFNRWARDNDFYSNCQKYPADIVHRVCEYYVKHGKAKTEERFPDVRVRSIVERYVREPRQIRWTGKQLIELARVAGLVSFEKQAKWFNRPGAYAGSIKAAWSKRFGHGGAAINGLSWWVAKHYVRPACPRLKTDFWKGSGKSRWVVLWVDVEKHLKSSTPDHIRDAIKAMARFQRWLHGHRVRANIQRLLEEVEYAAKERTC